MPTASPPPSSPKRVLTITDAAAHHIQELIRAREVPTKGVRISLKTKGCSGMAYALEYVDVLTPGDEHVCDKGVDVYIDPQAVLFLIGTHMDFDNDPLQPGFKFINPNEKGRCGCGQSFHV